MNVETTQPLLAPAIAAPASYDSIPTNVNMSKHSILFSFAAILLLMSPTYLTALRQYRFATNIHAHKVAAYTLDYIRTRRPRMENGEHVDGTPLLYSLFIKQSGWTGHLMLASIVAMCSTAYQQIRSRLFELFYYTHQLFLLCVALLFIHDENVLVRWYISVPLVVYFTDRIYRCIRVRLNRAQLQEITQLPAGVMKLRLTKGRVKSQPGQYLRVCCPAASMLQWHPVTITSSPEDNHLTLHLRVEGSWTRNLSHLFGCDFGKDPRLSTAAQTLRHLNNILLEDFAVSSSLPLVLVDGPYYSPFQQALKYEATVMIAAGIGITPAVSVLRTMCWRYKQDNQIFLTQGPLYTGFFAIASALQWFPSLFKTLGQDLWHVVDIHLYYTGGDPICHVPSASSFNLGRPSFRCVFEQIASTYHNCSIGVFFCGPASIANIAESEAEKWESIEFYSESFS
ncbi:hypothetical protein DL89DRAFT_268064 [Linderina pennispora]|uniref:FAD-binding FR-type domain-containing protein n=1 Tax=Linderina pennispora TaxID=61395 RepID=A0A1Y1W661_9FUNG|nr:uncharacterized protein DL89DRAFT_268064 [Linderina pennispora]ORX69027.1 hypothetical protein DL89DRAFT_268064 [Linderina pennispora]